MRNMMRLPGLRPIARSDPDCFWTDAYFHTPDEIEALFGRFDADKLEHASADV
ncbi:hypothetical protein [Paenibacillus sp. PK3_47]|uniref:hypothetical protein n=1 Tax=Paenibacillus sp. PK3_47 TaxID=2072642 RepID=UPI00201D993A|nr:hypothetical protein [Paenibacillus sp. PK3_47]